MSKTKPMAELAVVITASRYGLDLTKVTPADGRVIRESDVLDHLRRAGKGKAAAAGPWGSEDPVSWAHRTGRLMASSVARWRADHRADPAGTERWLALLSPTQEAGAVSARRAPRSTPSGAPRFSYSVNPILDSLDPAARSAGSASGQPAPTLFASGDTPSFTASGVDPGSLLDLPWQARHVVAAAPTRVEAYELAERYADSPDAAALDFDSHPANLSYAQRVKAWGVENMSDDEVYGSVFGDSDLAEVKAAEAKDRGARRKAAARQLDAIDDET